MQALEQMVAAGSGVHPRTRDGFQSLVGNPRYIDLTARIRRDNPPVNKARVAFDLTEADLVSEGIAWSNRTRKLYLGSIKRKIIAVTTDGRVAEFVPPGRDRLGVVIGLRVDDARGELWAASSLGFGGEPDTTATAGLYRFRLADGGLLGVYPLANDTNDFLNDVAVAPNGIAYATATNSGALLRIAPATGRSDVFLPAGALPDPNGIAATADGRYLLVAGWYGITRVDLRTRATVVLRHQPNVASGCFDGLYLQGPRDLIGVQNCVHDTGRIMHLRLNAGLDSIRSASVLESYNPLFNGITTAAIAGDTLFFVANVQFRKWGPNGPLAPFDPLHVLALPISVDRAVALSPARRRAGPNGPARWCSLIQLPRHFLAELSTSPSAASRSAQYAFICVAVAWSGSLVWATATWLFPASFFKKPTDTQVPSGQVMYMYFSGVTERTVRGTPGNHWVRVRGTLQAR